MNSEVLPHNVARLEADLSALNQEHEKTLSVNKQLGRQKADLTVHVTDIQSHIVETSEAVKKSNCYN
ncbi:hypothetical protein K470DRAFT_254697 [Piedraia hortae CBS 480.64]|uniref:Uncharacterized protein n=1 Tax=Piedraia hortae CBS 480.64 TaxID=1314780 RepID=A0A6A7C8A7_9PEZI|nr:hypothetical protein K470DRAFT_254697 [Piedraia hortae CBS 480.64]